MEYLGHIISTKGIEIDPKKTEAVKNWPRPLTPTGIRSFLGLSGYYKRFVDEFASVDSLLTTLTQKSVKSEWSKSLESILQVLKERFTSAPVSTLLEGTKD